MEMRIEIKYQITYINSLDNFTTTDFASLFFLLNNGIVVFTNKRVLTTRRIC